jgi:CheY-like chemotaxis protein
MRAEDRSKVVVVVDDEAPIVAVVCEVLEGEHVRAVACDNGNKALACIHVEKPDLVVLDVQMSGMDGIQIFQQMRADPRTAGIPVIFFTANTDLVTQRLPNFKALNANLLPKPVSFVKFLEMARGFLAEP